jgi:OOP family OmpA-OmpF porin
MEDGTVEFELGNATLDAASHTHLDDLGGALLRCETVWVDVSGHTDSSGDPAANLVSSKTRAQSLVQYLLAKGVPRTRIVANGFGAERPIADNETAAGRARNRRIEFRVVGVGDAE